MTTDEQHHASMRAKLAALAGDVKAWKEAVDLIRDDCACALAERAGFPDFDNSRCRAGRRCRQMTVLTIRTHMGMVRIDTRHLSAAAVPGMVTDLAGLFDELPATTQWVAFAERLQAIVRTGQDPERPQPAAAMTASPNQPKEHHPS